MLKVARCAAAAVVMFAVSGCTGNLESGGAFGDCMPRLHYQETVYASTAYVNNDAPQGELQGHSDLLGCDGKTLHSVAIRSVKGVVVEIAIAVGKGQWHGVYVSRDVPRAQWPPQLRASHRSRQ